MTEDRKAEILRYDREVKYVASRAVHFNGRKMTGETAAEANGNRGYADVARIDEPSPAHCLPSRSRVPPRTV